MREIIGLHLGSVFLVEGLFGLSIAVLACDKMPILTGRRSCVETVRSPGAKIFREERLMLRCL